MSLKCLILPTPASGIMFTLLLKKSTEIRLKGILQVRGVFPKQVCSSLNKDISETEILLFSFRRDPQNLYPPEVSNAKLQYAGWGPKGQQLVREKTSVPMHVETMLLLLGSKEIIIPF